MHDAVDRYLDTGEGRVFVRAWAPGVASDETLAPIVLFHDSLGCVELWREFPRLLCDASGRRVIAYDRPGFGRSDPHPSKLTNDFIADEAKTTFARVHEGLELDRFIAFGHSVGGGMAVACAAAHAQRCEGVVTESAQAFVEDRTLQGILAAKEDFARPGRIDRLRRYHGDKADWVLHAWIDTWLSPGFAAWTLDDELLRVRCRLLAMHGDRDEFGSMRHPERIVALCGGAAEIERLHDCGHVPHREHPDRVLARVRPWLDPNLP